MKTTIRKTGQALYCIEIGAFGVAAVLKSERKGRKTEYLKMKLNFRNE